MFIQEMTENDCLSVLARERFGRLGCARDNQPYVVPIYFVCEWPYLYGFTTPGVKIEWMRSNPLVCVQVDDVEAGDHWTSIQIFGRYEELTEPPGAPEWDPGQRHAHGLWGPPTRPTWTNFPESERLRALELLQRHAGWWEPGCACRVHSNREEPVTPVFYRIHIDRISGRRATPDSGGPPLSRTPPPARGASGWLRKALHALAEPFSGRAAMRRRE